MDFLTNSRSKASDYSTSARSSSSISNCNTGLRCIILVRIICGVSSISRKSAMSSSASRCSSVAISSNRSEQVALLQMDCSILALRCHSSVALRSGKRTTSRLLSTCMASLLKQPCIPPVASHTKSGMNSAATNAVFSLSTMATVLAKNEASASRCSPNRYCFMWKFGILLTECTQLT